MAKQQKGGKLRRTAKDSGYYDRQFFVTDRNKARRAAKRVKVSKSLKTAERRERRLSRKSVRKAQNMLRKQKRDEANAKNRDNQLAKQVLADFTS